MFIPVSLALLVLTAGMFLLAKTNKDNLGRFFKFISIFIIACSFLIMGLSLVRGFTKMILHKAQRQEQGFYREHRQHHRSFDREHPYRRMQDWNNRDEENNMPEYENEHRSHEFENFREPHQFRDHGWSEKNGGMRVERMVERYTTSLNLTADQIIKLKEILKSSFQKQKELMSQPNGNREQFRKLAKENRESRMEAIKKILTPEQLKVFNEQGERRDRRE